jgi:hypothetical protein
LETVEPANIVDESVPVGTEGIQEELEQSAEPHRDGNGEPSETVRISRRGRSVKPQVWMKDYVRE